MPTKPDKRILFLGVENHDRSRVAEILFNSIAAKMGLGWEATSKGLVAKRPTKKEGPMAAASVKLLQMRGIRGGDFTRDPIEVAEADFDAAEVMIALDRTTLEPLLREKFPNRCDAVEYRQISSGPSAFAEVEKEISNLVARLLGGTASERIVEPEPAAKSGKGPIVKVGRETKGRKGKGVTIVSELPLDEKELQELATLLKTRCGTGGTAKEGRIEIQGDQRDRLTAELEKLGYRVKRTGG